MSLNPDEELGKTALTVAAEFLKYTIALGTGSLVFSAGLVTGTVKVPLLGQLTLIASWFWLAVSVGSGVLAYSRIPIMLSERNYNVEDKYFITPGRIHELTFLLGIFLLGLTLALTLLFGTK